MPKIICTRCQTQMEIESQGVYVVEMFNTPPQPYKIWHADLWKCCGCQAEVVSGFGQQALAEHFEEDFPALLESINHTSHRVFFSYERPTPIKVIAHE